MTARAHWPQVRPSSLVWIYRPTLTSPHNLCDTVSFRSVPLTMVDDVTQCCAWCTRQQMEVSQNWTSTRLYRLAEKTSNFFPHGVLSAWLSLLFEFLFYPLQVSPDFSRFSLFHFLFPSLLLPKDRLSDSIKQSSDNYEHNIIRIVKLKYSIFFLWMQW